MKSLAILCIARNETPYIEEWLEYHFAIGVDRVYYVSTDDDFPAIVNFFNGSGFRGKVEVFHFQDFTGRWQINCYNQILPLINEDWLLVLDVDEFLYLNLFPCVQDYLETVSRSAGQVQFPWLMCITDGYCCDQVVGNHTRNHAGDHVKSMVRRENVVGLGIHRHAFRGAENTLSSGEVAKPKSFHDVFINDPSFFTNNPFVLHFCTRGHCDTITRILDHKFNNPKGNAGERTRLSDFLLNEASWSNIPNRYLLLKFYESLPKTSVAVSVPRIHSKTDVAEVKRIFMRNIGALIDFESTDLGNLENEFEDRFQLSRKLGSGKFSVTSDTDAYLRCLTQLEYIKKLRRSMEDPASC